MKRLIIFLLLFAAIKVAGQTTGYLRFDTVKIMKQNGTCELYLINKTKDSLGLLTNIGGGLTQFRKSRMLNDSTLVVGLDTLVIRGGTSAPGGIDQLTGDGAAGPGTGSQVLTISANAITNPKLAQMPALTVKVNATNSTANAQDLAFSTDGNVLVRDGTTLITGPLDLSKSGARTGLLPEDNLAAFRTYPPESSNEKVLLDQSTWTASDLGAQFSRGANHTISLNGAFPRIASSTIVWGGASLTRFLPNLPIIGIYDKIEVDYQIVSALASNVGFGPSMFSNNVNGANFGYTTYLAVATSTATPHFAKQDGTSDQTAATFTVSQGDVIRQTIEFLDTVAIATFQNITTSSAIRTITKTFTAGVAPYPPNTGTWGFQNFSGTYEIRRVRISTRKTMSPTLMVAFDSKGQIVADPWSARFPSRLNARYPTVLNYSGGGDQLKDFIDKRIEFSRINPEQVLIGLGSNDLRYGSSLATTLERVDKVVKMISGSTTRWAITVVPEDSTGSGIGLTAFKNAISATYPSNYIDLWTISSTSNILKAEYNSGDDVHPNTEWHRIADSVIAATGFYATISVNRRTPFLRFGGGIYGTGDSLYSVFKPPFAPNSILRFNDSNQVTHSIAFGTTDRFIISPNYPHAQSVSSSTSFHLDGLQSYTGPNGGNLFYDRTNTTNFHSLYSNNNVLRFGYNAVDNTTIDNNGFVGVGYTLIGLTMTPSLSVKKSRTLGAGAVDSRGLNFVSDTMTATLAAGMTTNFYGNKIAAMTIAAGGAHVSTRPINFVVEGVIEGTNVDFVNPYAFGVLKGRSYFDSTINLNNIATGDSDDSVLVKAGDGDVKMIAQSDLSGGSGITSINSETGPGITIAAGTGISVNTTTNTVTVSANPNYELYYSDNSSTTVANTTSETTLYGTGAGTAEFTNVTAGSVLTLKGSGTISTAASPGTPELGLHIGNYTLGMSLTSLTGALSNVFFDYHFEIIPVGTGASQDIMVYCKVNVHETVTTVRSYTFTQRSSASFTTTGTPDADVTIEWSAADPANSVTGHKNTVEIYRK